jgi:hypothetical protein
MNCSPTHQPLEGTLVVPLLGQAGLYSTITLLKRPQVANSSCAGYHLDLAQCSGELEVHAVQCKSDSSSLVSNAIYKRLLQNSVGGELRGIKSV